MMHVSEVKPEACSDVPRRRRPRGVLRAVVVLAGLGLVAGGLVGFHRFKAHILQGVVANITSKRPTVSSKVAAMATWQRSIVSNGSFRASQGVDLAAEVGGIVSELHFESGEQVAAGALLMRLRPNDDDAKLAQLQATAELDAITYQRDAKQLRAQGVAQATVDTDLGNLRSAQAQVAAQQALILQKFVRAPFAGRVGLRQVDLGQFLSAGTKIVTLQALDPMLFDFYVPQQSVGELAVGQQVTLHVAGVAGDVPGQVAAINPQADASSRMIQVRARVSNPEQRLLPGMFATVEIAAGAPQDFVTVPLAAVTAQPYGSMVYVLASEGAGADGTPRPVARQVFVTTGEARGDQVQVLQGLKAGDVVVTAGQLKLHNGSEVVVDDSVQPSDDPNPRPRDQ